MLVWHVIFNQESSASTMWIYKRCVWVEQIMTCKEKTKRAFYFSLAFLHKTQTHFFFLSLFLSECSLRSAAYTMPLRSSPSRLCSADGQKSRLSLVLSCLLSVRSSQAWLHAPWWDFPAKQSQQAQRTKIQHSIIGVRTRTRESGVFPQSWQWDRFPVWGAKSNANAGTVIPDRSTCGFNNIWPSRYTHEC